MEGRVLVGRGLDGEGRGGELVFNQPGNGYNREEKFVICGAGRRFAYAYGMAFSCTHYYVA